MTRTRKVSIVFLILLLIIAICPCMSVLSIGYTSPLVKTTGRIIYESPPITELHVEGNLIKDEDGQTVLLRGVNQAGFIDCPTGFWRPEGGGIWSGLGVWDPDAVAANLDVMKEWGCNLIRLHTTMFHWIHNSDTREGQPVGQAYKQNLHDIMDMAYERGIYVIIELASGKPSPDYRVPALPYQPYCPTEDNDVFGVGRQFFVDYWEAVALEYRNHPNVIFELQNEPHQATGYSYQQSRDEWFGASQDCINAIRATGAEQLIIIGWGWSLYVDIDVPSSAFGLEDWMEEYIVPGVLTDPLGNLVYTFHVYRGPHRNIQKSGVAAWTYDDLKTGLELCKVDYYAQQYPIFMGEFGAYAHYTGVEWDRELEQLESLLTISEEWGLHYAAWVWSVPAHQAFGLLQDGTWIPSPNQAGQLLVDALGGESPLGVTVAPSASAIYLDYTQEFTADAGGGTAPYSYDWMVEDISQGETSNTLVFDTATFGLGTYDVYCVCTDNTGASAESNHATAYVVEEPEAPETFSDSCDSLSPSDGTWGAYYGTVQVSETSPHSSPACLLLTKSDGAWNVWAEKVAPWGVTGRAYWNWKNIQIIQFAFKTNHPETPVSFILRVGVDWESYSYTLDTSGLTANTWHILSVDITQPDDNGNTPLLNQIAAFNLVMGYGTSAPDGYWGAVDTIEGN